MKNLMTLALAGGLAVVAFPAAAGQSLIEKRCAQCHEPKADGGFNRISDMRKTPEGWLLSIQRMRMIHGVQLERDEVGSLVKHLADSQGLAPAEAAPYRYMMERTPNVIEAEPDNGLGVMCARCHSFGRVALERRDAPEWTKLAHFHLGQFPTAEYQAGARDMKWWETVSTQVPKTLGEMFPFDSQEWRDWQKAAKADLAGRWLVSGERPDGTLYGGTITVAADGADAYSITYALADAAGKPIAGNGKGVVYTGYEWRGQATLNGQEVREVLALSADGATLSGRTFLADADEIGGSFTAMRDDGKPRVAGLSRGHLKAGETARLTIWGAGLSGNVALGDGVTTKVVSRTPEAVVVEATAAAGAKPGLRDVTVGKTQAAALLTVYDKIDLVKVEPEFAIARVGGGGGPIAPVKAQFHAVAYMAGPDGQPGTEDDIRIGVMPATWSLAPNGEFSEAMDDVKFVGELDGSGLFHPASAGPNPERPMSANNVGDLVVNAKIGEVEGAGRLIVTVQRWNDPPLR